MKPRACPFLFLGEVERALLCSTVKSMHVFIHVYDFWFIALPSHGGVPGGGGSQREAAAGGDSPGSGGGHAE